MSAQLPTHIPHAQVHERLHGDNLVHTTEDLFDGQKVVMFALPGAFTPTCSKQHLPGFEQAYDALQAQGVDRVICLSVNDAWVMEAWASSLAINKVQMIADGNGDLTKALGLQQDLSKAGFGLRSKRYAMLVQDGRIEKLFLETAGLAVSDAQTMLNYLTNAD